MTTLAGDSTDDRLKQDNRKPPCDASPADIPSNPIRPPFLSDGLEPVRGSDC